MKYNDAYRAIFGEDRVQEKYKLIGHSFSRMAGGKHYCVSCGLVALRNRFSDWSVDKGCLSHLHPDYNRMRKLTGFN